MSDHAPDDCPEAAHDAAHGVAPGYEEFCEEFAGGDHDAAEKVARHWAEVRIALSAQDIARQTMSELLENITIALDDVCDAVGLRHYYDAALEAAWRDHQEAGQ